MAKYKSAIAKAALIGIFALFISASLFGGREQPTHISYKEFAQYVEAGDVEQATLSGGATISFTLRDDAAKYITDNPRTENFKETLLLSGTTVSEGGSLSAGGVTQALVSVAIFAGAFFLMYKMSGRAGVRSAMSVNVADVGAEGLRFSFDDVAGNEEAKESVADIVDFIKNPDKYASYGARMPRGVIFYGPPGTGKTLMAKAVAGEAGVPFYAVSGSDFVQMYVGVGANRVRELFKKARQNGRAVIFIDEIDALGKKRSATANGSNDERDQTLNALLTEMSGFLSGDGVVVLAATNRVDMLDDALLRPGRFDRQVEIGLPDICARRSILARHGQGKPLAKEVCLDRLAKETVFFSGAMLENFLNEAAIISAKANKPVIDNKDLEKAYYTILAGSEKKSQTPNRDRIITAFHEAGHAIVGFITAPENKLAKMTIIPSTKGAGGFCVNIPSEKMFYTKKDLQAQIMTLLGGRAAEELVFGSENITTGACNDLEKATSIALDYVAKYGMGNETGLLNTQHFPANAGFDIVHKECASLLDSLYLSAKNLLEDNIHKLNKLAYTLMEKESLTGQEMERIVA